MFLFLDISTSFSLSPPELVSCLLSSVALCFGLSLPTLGLMRGGGKKKAKSKI